MDAPEEILKRFQRTYQEALKAEQELLKCALKLEADCTRLGKPPELKRKLETLLIALQNQGEAREKARQSLWNLHKELGVKPPFYVPLSDRVSGTGG
ncbi:MAG: hypothetical protein ACPG1C_03105, partial [Alphaproteobacteria bacterium]